MHISTLPDLCLLHIFKCLNPNDVLCKASQVCTRWQHLVTVVCKQRHVLQISMLRPLADPYRLKHAQRYLQLQKPHLQEASNKIVQHFPKLTSLRIGGQFSGLDEQKILHIPAVIRLLTEWKGQIVSLQLSYLYTKIDGPADFKPLVEAINSLVSLRHLSLCNAISPHAICHLTVLSHLVSFTYNLGFDEHEHLSIDGTVPTTKSQTSLSAAINFTTFHRWSQTSCCRHSQAKHTHFRSDNCRENYPTWNIRTTDQCYGS